MRAQYCNSLHLQASSQHSCAGLEALSQPQQVPSKNQGFGEGICSDSSYTVLSSVPSFRVGMGYLMRAWPGHVRVSDELAGIQLATGDTMVESRWDLAGHAARRVNVRK